MQDPLPDHNPSMLSLLITTALCGQILGPVPKEPERTYLDQVLAPTTRAKAVYYRVPAGRHGDHYLGKILTMSDVLKAEGHYADGTLAIPHGHFVFYYPDGKKESEGDYNMGHKTGIWKRYDKWGEPLAEKVYDLKLLDELVYTVAPTMPSYPGGERAMITYLKNKAGSADGATATFVVEKDGALSDIKVLGAPDEMAGQLTDALRQTPRFPAGEKDGLPVRVQMRVPLK